MIGHRYLRNVISPVMREVSEEKYKDSDTAVRARLQAGDLYAPARCVG